MPEGDTIHTLARFLKPRLTGVELVNGRLRDRPDARFRGRRVESVYAHGKHLFFRLHDGVQLRSHLGMRGSWHRYGPGEAWQRPQQQASIQLETRSDVFVCFNAKEVEMIAPGSVRERQIKARLGPDLLAADFSREAVLARARDFLAPETLAVDTLLDQRVASGIGNVYKSEVLFLQGIHPETPLEAITDDALGQAYEKARTLLRANTRGGPRVTRALQPASHSVREGSRSYSRLWVYRRGGQACLRCKQAIHSAPMGTGWRSTYWCSNCQPLTESP